MCEMIAVVFEDVEAFVLDFPPRSCAGGDLSDVFARDLERGDEGAVVGRLALGVADGDADPIDDEGVLAVAQRRLREPAVSVREPLCEQKYSVPSRAISARPPRR